MGIIHLIIRLKFYFIVRNYIESQVRDFKTIHNNLVYYRNNNDTYEGRIGLFNSYTFSVEEIEKFNSWYEPYEVATTQNKVNSYVRYLDNFSNFRFLELTE